MHLQQCTLPVLKRQGRTFLDQVVREAVYATFRKLRRVSYYSYHLETFCRRVRYLFAARFARVLVAVACIFELRAALEVFEDQLVGSAAHDQPRS